MATPDLFERVTLDRYSRSDLALLLGISPVSVSRYLTSGRIAYDLKEGRSEFFSQAYVLRFLRDDYCAPRFRYTLTAAERDAIDAMRSKASS